MSLNTVVGRWTTLLRIPDCLKVAMDLLALHIDIVVVPEIENPEIRLRRGRHCPVPSEMPFHGLTLGRYLRVKRRKIKQIVSKTKNNGAARESHGSAADIAP